MNHLEWKKPFKKKTWRIDYQIMIHYDCSQCEQRLKWINKKTYERKKMSSWLRTTYFEDLQSKFNKCLSKMQIATSKSICHSRSCALDFDKIILFIQWFKWRSFSSRTREQTKIRIKATRILIVECFWC